MHQLFPAAEDGGPEQLFNCPRLHEAHFRLSGCDHDRLGITVIIFVNLDVRPDIKWLHEPKLMSVLNAKTTNVMRAAASLHRNNAGV